MIAEVMAREALAADADVLDMFAGSGALAIAAGRLGARSVTAVDLSRRALAGTWLNARRNQVGVQVRRSNLFASLGTATFDLILANPPYYPGTDQLARRGTARAVDGGPAGRMLIDAFCREAPPRLRPGGSILLVHATFNGERETLAALGDTGLEGEVAHRHRGPWGPVGRARLQPLTGDDEEETIVIRARRAA
jgi:release factor glutamine methyltransferase